MQRVIRNAVGLLAIVAVAQFVVCSPASASAAVDAPKKQIHEAWWQKTSIEVGVGIYMWFYDRFHSTPSAWRGAPRSAPQGAPGDTSDPVFSP